ncbi:uncharacterized protein [Branchiostoma lanceolatum]|uniref:uncharacterized protein n=1 Tax=Branchiostoma lanceolatum TaxID=7740 RepID=UPI0034513872
MGITNGNTPSKVIFAVFGMFLGYGLSSLQHMSLHSAFEDSPCIQSRPVPMAVPQNTPRPQQMDGPRKILLDCGANVASTVQLFRETYPDGKDYIIHSFELDARLAPYFASYSNHVLHCPVAVAGEDGNITAYAESAWKPDKGKVAGKDMQWGGGAIYASESEKKDEIHGRRFGVKNVIPMVDLSTWIQTNTALEDYVIFKLDVEGAEYEILEKMIKEGTFN